MEFIVRILGFLTLRHPKVVMTLVALALLASALGIPRIGFQAGLRSIFDSENPVFADYIAHNTKFSQNETDILLLVRAKAGMNSEGLSDLRDFVLEAQFLPGVGAVYSLFSLRSWSANDGFAPLFPFDLSDGDAVDAALDTAEAQTLFGLSPLSKDRKKSLILISLAPGDSPSSDPTTTLQALEALAAQTAQNARLEIEMTGLLVARDEIISGLKTDQLKINLLGAIFGFLVSILLFRNLFAACLNASVPVFALINVLGFFGWAGFSINALTNALPVLILVLAGSDSIHMTFDLRRRLSEGTSPGEAIIACLRDTAGPVALTSLTTILAFASLLASDSPIVREFAVTGCVGVFFALVTVLLVHPLVFSLAMRHPRLHAAMKGIQGVQKVSDTRIPAKRFDRWIATGGIGLTVLCFAVLWPIQPSYRFMENINNDSQVSVIKSEIEEFTGPFSTIEIPLQLNPNIEISDPSVETDLIALSDTIKSIKGVSKTASLSDLKQLAQRWQDIPLILNDLPDEVRAKLVSQSNRRLVMTLRVADQGSVQVQQIGEAVNAALSTLSLTSLTAEAPTGFLLMSAILSDDMILQLAQSFLLAALICPMVIGLWYRRMDFALIAILPNVLPIALVAAGLTLIDLDIQLTAALAMTIAFGIALDDSIHVFNRVHLMQNQGIETAMRLVRPVLITTTLILSAGLVATQFSSMPTVRFFGLLCVAVFVFALICDLILLPALLRLAKGIR